MAITELFARLGTALFGASNAEPADAIDSGLVEQAVDAIVEAVDPRLRLMPRYRQKLAPAATRSIRLMRSLAPQLPNTIELSRAAWGADQYINAFFATGADVQTLLDRSTALDKFFTDPANVRHDAAYGVLAMRREERNVLASALVDGELRGDVAQTTVGFTTHTLIGIAGELSITRGLLGEAILKRIAGLVLERIVAERDRATELEMRKSVTATKLRMLELRRGGLQQLATGEQDPSPEIAALERELKMAAKDHMEIKASLATLDHIFEHIETVFGEPAKYLGLDTVELRVSHTGYKLSAASRETAAELRLNELWIGSSLRAVIVPVRITRPATTTLQST